MIEIITRIRYPELYSKMQESAQKTASGPVSFSAMFDNGQPKLAETYNLMGAVAIGDILLFVHDDIVFLSHGWDQKIKDAMALGFNCVGVTGSKKYEGGMVFDAGREYSAGRVCGLKDGKRVVRVMEHRADVEPVKVVDGMLMAVERKHFQDTGFDMNFDGLFFYDLDFCLRSKCAVVNALVSHEKPPHLYGQYPPEMKPMSHYEPAFNKKHGFGAPFIGDQRCDSIAYEEYVKELAEAK